VVITECPSYQTQCPAELTVCPIDPTGNCITNIFGTNIIGRVIRSDIAIPATAAVVPGQFLRPFGQFGRVCPIGTERVPQLASGATKSAPGAPVTTGQAEPAAVRPQPAEKPMASGTPFKAPVAALPSDLMRARPTG
jgi:hypothetical protein